MRLRWVAVALVALTACASAQDPSDTPEPTESSALPTAAPTEPVPSTDPTDGETPTEVASAEPTEAPTTGPPPAGQTVDVFLFREQGNGDGFWVEPQSVQLPAGTVGVARAALEALIATRRFEPGLDNLLPPETEVLGVDIDGTTLVVDLDFPDDELPLGAQYEASAFAQIAHTGSQFPTVRRVQVLEEGRTPPSGHSDWSKPLRADPFELVPVDIESPAYGATVPAGDVTVTGTANTFEATVQLRLRNPAGDVVENTFTTATCGSGCRGTWTHTFAGLDEPGTWTVAAAESDPSDGEGRPPFRVKTTFTVE